MQGLSLVNMASPQGDQEPWTPADADREIEEWGKILHPKDVKK